MTGSHPGPHYLCWQRILSLCSDVGSPFSPVERVPGRFGIGDPAACIRGRTRWPLSSLIAAGTEIFHATIGSQYTINFRHFHEGLPDEVQAMIATLTLRINVEQM